MLSRAAFAAAAKSRRSIGIAAFGTSRTAWIPAIVGAARQAWKFRSNI
jgi:hypothetical protein